MKYMGSKRSLLQNGLGELVLREARRSTRFVDLFSGTGRVAATVAENVATPVIAVDLQLYAKRLASPILERTEPLDAAALCSQWLGAARRSRSASRAFRAAQTQQQPVWNREGVISARRLCAEVAGGPIWTAYGGHYYSPMQAATFDALLRTLPATEPLRATCWAAAILAASRCAAAPGHTAQPFQPTDSALPYIQASWGRDPLVECELAVSDLSSRHAMQKGLALVGDANEYASSLADGDLVFLDPPYSSVHYSRFYHVLETMARGECGTVAGVGRYPPTPERPMSAYSVKSTARPAMLELLSTIAERDCRVILTFPQSLASNGIGGEDIVRAARRWFVVDARVVASRFSTLGGNNGNRSARRRSGELIALMAPK